jgi:hypothetical protein
MARWKNRMAVSNSRCIRQHSAAHISIRQQLYGAVEEPYGRFKLALHTSAFVSIRQHTSAYVSIRQQPYGRLKLALHAAPAKTEFVLVWLY